MKTSTNPSLPATVEMMSVLKSTVIAVALAAGLLAGCTARHFPPSAPGPVPPPQTVPADPGSGPGYQAGPAAELWAQSVRSLAQGNYALAEMTLERALRIEPRNARYWHTMAQIKFRQQDYSQAVHLGLKSKSLAGGDEALAGLNDALIYRSREALSGRTQSQP